MNIPTKYGITAALLAIFLFGALYFVEKQLIVNPIVKSIRYPVYIVLAWIALGKSRGSIVDKEALVSWIRPAFIVFIIASTIFSLFEFIVFRFADEELYQLSSTYLNEHFPEIQPKGKPGRINNTAPVLLEDAVSISRTFFTLALEIVVGFFFSVFIGLIWRNKE